MLHYLAVDIGEVEAAACVHPIHVGAQLLQQLCGFGETGRRKARALLNILYALHHMGSLKGKTSVTQLPVHGTVETRRVLSSHALRLD